MQISDAVEVIEVHGHVAANEKLVVGWTLLAVIPATSPNHGAGYGVYVLGKPAAKSNSTLEMFKEKGAFQPPKA